MNHARIVLAEDSTELRQLIATGLEHVGFDVIQAKNGAELVAYASDIANDQAQRSQLLIITDVRMPELDGISAVRALRKAGIEVPVIFMSAFGDKRARGEAKSLESRWLDKPVGLNALRAAVIDILGDQTRSRY